MIKYIFLIFVFTGCELCDLTSTCVDDDDSIAPHYQNENNSNEDYVPSNLTPDELLSENISYATGCVDFYGRKVVEIEDYTINDVAIARNEYDYPVIRFNPNVLSQLQHQTRTFFYYHECAHHVLAHTFSNANLAKERDADCWAVKTMNKEQGISTQDLWAIQTDISKLSGDWTHLPGPARAVDIENCLTVDSPNDEFTQPTGYSNGTVMQACGCWGYNPPSVAQEPLCQSGLVNINACMGGCSGGGSPYGYTCQ